MKVACLTVIYPGMTDFLDEYIRCIQAQTFKEFELIIINDQFPLSIKRYIEKAGVKVKVFNCSESPQKNRLYGLKLCKELGYDIIVCSDSDETMYSNRIEKNIEYFARHKESKIVYNNSVGMVGEQYFDLYYKDSIGLSDILDFNVLGYGALNLRSEMVPFILDRENEKVMVFDWWIGLVYLLHFKHVDFLKDAKNNYIAHSGNFVGPVFDVNKERIQLGIKVKKELYSELILYCHKNLFQNEERIFVKKLDEVLEIEKFISSKSLDCYTQLVEEYFTGKEKIYWWQDVVPLQKIRGDDYA